MREKIRRVYYCDFCKAKRMRRDSMEMHEKYCTANPHRECRLCRSAEIVTPDFASPSVAVMVHILEEGIAGQIKEEGGCFTYQETHAERNFARLRDVTACPACIFAAIRQSRWPWLFEYNFKAEADKMYAEALQPEEKEYARGLCY